MSDYMGQAKVLSGQLSERQIAALKGEVEKYRSAQQQMTEALGVLWNSQLDLAISLGRADRIIETMRRPVEFYDNCNCTRSDSGSGPITA